MAGNDTLDIYQELINRDAVPAQHRDTVDELVRRGVLKGKAAAPQKVEPDFKRYALQQGTFGTSDEILAGMETPFRMASDWYNQKPVSIGGAYDAALKRQREARDADNAYYGGTAAGVAGSVVGGLLTAPAQGASAVAQGAAPFLTTVRQMQVPLAVAGAKFGGATAFGETDGSSDPNATLLDHASTRAAAVPHGMAQGAAGALVFGNTLAGLMKGRDVWRDRSTARAVENQNRLTQFQEAGITDPLPAAVSASPLAAPLTRASGAAIGGNPIGTKARENIAQVEAGINRTLARPIDGQEAGDLGRNIQNDLRRALTTPSRSSDEIARMSDQELQGITGPVSPEGFQPPRPNIRPIPPKDVAEVQPRDVGQPPAPPAASNSVNELNAAYAAKARDIEAATADYNHTATAYHAVEQRYKPILDQYDRLLKQEQIIRDRYNDMAGNYIRRRNPGETVQNYQVRMQSVADSHAAIRQQIEAMRPDYEVAQRALNAYGSMEERVARIRQMHSERDQIEKYLNEARGSEAAQKVHFEQAQRDYTDARVRAASEAADETSRLREQARFEAEQSTIAAQRAADERYQQQIREGNSAFRIGNSRESYPTELSAAYTLAERNAPKGVKITPLGDQYGGSSTTAVLDSIAKEGKQSLQIRDFDGRVFDDGGGLTPQFAQFLRGRIGNDMTARLEALAELRNRGPIPQMGVQGVRSLLSDMRTLARDAEKSRYSPTPRTEDAAMLRRLASALQDDLYQQLGRTGTPPSFKTADGEYKVSSSGAAQADGRAPSDATYYVTPEQLNRLTRGNPQKGSFSIPANLSLKAEGNTVGYFNNMKKEFDRSSLIPFNRNPEEGLIPIQVWADGTRITYGSPVISRATTSGERAVAMFKNTDEQYAQYINELRKPLSKIYGEKVDGVQALDRLVKAAQDGETGMLNAFMRVMNEKGDPTKGASAIIYHMTGGGKDLSRFMEAWRGLPPVSRRAIFNNGPARELERDLNRYVAVGERLERFVNASRQNMAVNPARITHLLTLSALYTHWPAVIAATAGNAVASRALSSPRLLKWMTQLPNAGRGGFETPAFRQHVGRLGAVAATGKEKEEARALLNGIKQAIAGGPAFAQRFDQSYDPAADEIYRNEGQDAVDRPTPVPAYVPPQAFRDPIYMPPPKAPRDGLNLEDRPYFWEREVYSDKMPRIPPR